MTINVSAIANPRRNRRDNAGRGAGLVLAGSLMRTGKRVGLQEVAKQLPELTTKGRYFGAF